MPQGSDFKGVVLSIAHYDRFARWLHWLVVILVVVQFATGWGWGNFTKGSTPRFILFQIHLYSGYAILAAALVRLVWRATHPVPPMPDTVGRLQALAARAVHWLLYGCIILQPVLGILTITAFGKSLGTWPRIAHVQMQWVILALVGLHVAAALWHQFVKRDHLLERMLPS
jgi:cytochrome b561